MKKRHTILLAAAILCAAACSKAPVSGLNDASKRYFDAWAQVNIPGAEQTELGSYIIERTDGDGIEIGDSAYIRCNYTIRNLNGTVQKTTSATVAQQIGSYHETYFYGPMVWARLENSLYAGIEELIEGMHVGMKVKAAIPGWLITTKRYSKPELYLKNVTGTDTIYEIEVTDAFSDVTQHELDSIARFLRREYPMIDPADTVDSERNAWGLYYITEKYSDAPDSTYNDESKIYFNYTGRLLNGTVFDTSIERVAKDAGIYNASKTYGPTYITWYAEGYKNTTMGSDASSTIDGFAYALYNMKPHEKGKVIFHSLRGYSYSGSGSTIPAYSPLIFELELVDNPDE